MKNPATDPTEPPEPTGAQQLSGSASAITQPLPLFPLRMVLVPGAQLGLKIFEARYLDLVSRCLRSGQPFGVICLTQGAEAGAHHSAVKVEAVGTLAHIEEVDAEQPGILRLQCRAGQRFKRLAEPVAAADGLWTAPVELLREDAVRAPGPALAPTVQALAEAIKALLAQDQAPFAPPYRLDDAGWVANRWCELLPLPLGARQKLMAMDDPVIRLSLIDGFLRDKKLIVG
jgi:uncharacterized protein